MAVKRSIEEAKAFKNSRARAKRQQNLAIPGWFEAETAKNARNRKARSARGERRIRIRSTEEKARNKKKRETPESRDKVRIRVNLPKNKAKKSKSDRVRATSTAFREAQKTKRKARYVNPTHADVEARKAKNARQNIRRSDPAVKLKAQIKRDVPAVKEKERLHRSTPEYRAIGRARYAARKKKLGIITTIRKKRRPSAQAEKRQRRKKSPEEHKALRAAMRATPAYKIATAIWRSKPANKLKMKLRSQINSAKNHEAENG